MLFERDIKLFGRDIKFLLQLSCSSKMISCANKILSRSNKILSRRNKLKNKTRMSLPGFLTYLPENNKIRIFVILYSLQCKIEEYAV